MRLGVNIDHVATVREARGGAFPDPIESALLAEEGGADSIVCHLREDRRHIQDRDLPRLKRALRIPLNLEMAAVEEIVRVALGLGPDRVTFVPERRRELTTEGGLAVAGAQPRFLSAVARFKDRGIKVSLFIEPDRRAVEASAAVGADMVELHTGRYAEGRPGELRRLRTAARLAREAGLGVAAGHGLDRSNVRAIVAIRIAEELNIGHSIVGRAIMVGMRSAVREIKRAISKG